MGDLLADAASVNPEGTAATLGPDQISYRQLEQEARVMTAGLAGLVEPGQRIVW